MVAECHGCLIKANMIHWMMELMAHWMCAILKQSDANSSASLNPFISLVPVNQQLFDNRKDP